jgi:hypothetical protein
MRGKLDLSAIYRRGHGRDDFAPYPLQRTIADAPELLAQVLTTGIAKHGIFSEEETHGL